MPCTGVVACRAPEGLREAERRFLLVFVNLDALGEGLVPHAFPVGVGRLVELLAVHEQLQGAGDLFSRAWELVVLGADAWSMSARAAQMGS